MRGQLEEVSSAVVPHSRTGTPFTPKPLAERGTEHQPLVDTQVLCTRAIEGLRGSEGGGWASDRGS